MAQVKLLKISSVDGVPQEMNTTSDDITLNSFTVQGGGPALSPTGLALASQAISASGSVSFSSPSTATINQTASNLIIDNIMGKDRPNLMATGATVAFPVITDTAANTAALRLPQLAGVPASTPTNGGAGQLVYNTTGDGVYLYTGTVWRNLADATDAMTIQDTYTAGATITAVQAVYLSAADTVSPAIATAPGTSQVLGFANTGAASAASVKITKFGKLSGFTSLTAGSRYFLDTVTAGNVTATIPSTSGASIVQVGYAKNTTTLDVTIQQLGRRA